MRRNTPASIELKKKDTQSKRKFDMMNILKNGKGRFGKCLRLNLVQKGAIDVRHLLTAAGLTFCLFGTSHAGYVWTENSIGNYGGTVHPWVSEDSISGKWVNAGTANVFEDDVNVTGGTNFTIDGASVSTEKIMRVEQGEGNTVFTIQNGGKFMTSNVITISDSSGKSTGTVSVSGGTLESTSEIRVGFHWQGYLNVMNGGTVSTTQNILVGGSEARKGIGHITIGGLDSQSNTGTLSAAVMNLGISGPGDSEMTINRGTVTLSTLNLGVSGATGDGNVYDSIVTVNPAGILTLSGNIVTGNHVERRGVVNAAGGNISANRIILSANAGTDSQMDLTGGTVQFRDRMVVGQLGTAELNVSGGTLVGSTVNDAGNTIYRSLFIGGNPDVETGNGEGTINVTGGEVIVNGLHVGTTHEGTLNISGSGSVQTYAEFNLGFKAGSDGTLNVSGGTLTLGNTLTVGFAGKGTMEVSGGLITGEKVSIKPLGTFRASGGNLASSVRLEGGSFLVSDTKTDAPVSYSNLIFNSGTGYIQNAKLVSNPKVGNTEPVLDVNSMLDVGEGGVVDSYGMFRLAQNNSGTLFIHDGGQVLFSGRFLVGDGPTRRGTIIVDGPGSLLESRSETQFGYHGSAEVYVRNGGTISGGNINLGLNNNAAEVAPSDLTIMGKDSLVSLTGTFNVGSNNQKSILHFVADSTGFGKLKANTLNRNTAKESEIRIALENPFTLFDSVPADGWQIVETATLTNWTAKASGLWDVTANGGNVTVKLSSDTQLADLIDGTDLRPANDLAFTGWTQMDIGADADLMLTLDGVSSEEEMLSFIEWFADELGGLEVQREGKNSLILQDYGDAEGIFAWDFETYNEMNGTNLSLAYLSAHGLAPTAANVPEPGTWSLMLLGIGLGFCRFVRNRK